MGTRQRIFAQIVPAEEPADRERLERAEHLMDPIREVTVIEDQPRNGDWWVEYFGSDGSGYVTIFDGPEAARRAGDYFQGLRAIKARGSIIQADDLHENMKTNCMRSPLSFDRGEGA
jgi:hypothetical protein